MLGVYAYYRLQHLHKVTDYALNYVLLFFIV